MWVAREMRREGEVLDVLRMCGGMLFGVAIVMRATLLQQVAYFETCFAISLAMPIRCIFR